MRRRFPWKSDGGIERDGIYNDCNYGAALLACRYHIPCRIHHTVCHDDYFTVRLQQTEKSVVDRVDFAGAGATVPLTGFGYSIAKGVEKAVNEYGLLGALTGGITATAAGITASIFFGYIIALVAKPGDKS